MTTASATLRRRSRARLARLASVAVPLALGGCAYYNGIYNAKASARTGDKLAGRGLSAQAEGAYALAAEKAETVLARYPRSRWRPEALYVAGRSEALIGRCVPAEARLTEFLALPRQSGSARSRATLALGACYVRTDRTLEGRRLLEPLLGARDKRVASEAALWMARAAIAMGETDAAERYLSGLPAGAAQWELATASLERQQYARAESLLVIRARQGDYRDEVGGVLRTLWSARRHAGVERVVDAYASARTPVSAKISLHLLAADLLQGERRDSLARLHLQRAQSLAVDTISTREVAARLCGLELAAAGSVADAGAALTRFAPRATGSPLFERMSDNVMLLQLLERQPDFTGVQLFLAAEVARDSLRAPRLAHALFARVASSYPNALISPKALLAAAAILPESAEVYHERVRTRYPRSPYAVLLAGGDPSDLVSYATVEDALRRGWGQGLAQLADTVGKLRPQRARAAAADSLALADSIPRGRAGPRAVGAASPDSIVPDGGGPR